MAVLNANVGQLYSVDCYLFVVIAKKVLCI